LTEFRLPGDRLDRPNCCLAAKCENSTAATELGNLGEDTNGNTVTQGYAINTVGMVAGYAGKYDGSGNYLGDVGPDRPRRRR
jgi:hypothetical protein